MLALSTEVSKRLEIKLFWVLAELRPTPMALSGLLGVMVWLDQRRPRLSASSREISAMMAEIKT